MCATFCVKSHLLVYTLAYPCVIAIVSEGAIHMGVRIPALCSEYIPIFVRIIYQ